MRFIFTTGESLGCGEGRMRAFQAVLQGPAEKSGGNGQQSLNSCDVLHVVLNFTASFLFNF